ncbi:Scr1 family TA system antitoxin-like transcriptional regulator [Nocardia sp. NPDC004068]|uniref:helix-turn-helix domain-containing protein n=1 Tax=Nocardia sp. NPDC004068 TaxID=3364303 RepID=UPI0036B37B82
MPALGSTLARRALGRQLNAFRKKAEISQAQAAKFLGISPQTMGRMEDGVSMRSATDLHVNELCNRYGVGDDKRRLVLALAREARIVAKHGGGWWRADADQGDGFDHYPVLLNSAQRMTAWRVVLLPEIVQTRDYQRAVAWAKYPSLPSDEIDKHIESSAKRQRPLDDSAFTVEILLSEAAIREEWGGPAVMAEQRRHLADIGRRSNVSIRVVPFQARSHIGALAGSFSLLEFPVLPHSKLVEPPVVHVEEYTGDLYLERAEEISRYRDAIAELRRVALSESDSSALILGI